MAHHMKKKFSTLLSVLFLGLLVVAPIGVIASSFSVESVGGSLGLGNADLKTTVLNVLNWVLGLLALIAVAMIIFSGFIAASSPDAERGERARRVITGAIIGLIIVLLAWAVVLFVTRTTANVTVST